MTEKCVLKTNPLNYLNRVLFTQFYKRYCSQLEQNTSSTLYPIYKIIELETDTSTTMFKCKVRLPPNSVFNTEIEVILLINNIQT